MTKPVLNNAEDAKNKIAKLLQRAEEPYYLFVNIADASGLDPFSVSMLEKPARSTSNGMDPVLPRETNDELEYFARALVNAIAEKGRFRELELALARYKD